MDAALELFYQQGALATTVREITQACGLTPGALYNHFASKEELLYTLVWDLHVRLERRVESAQAECAGDPVAELCAIVRTYVDVHSHRREGSRVANREYTLLTGERLREIVAIRRRMRDRLVAVLEAGERQGYFDLGCASPTLTAIAILDMCIHISEWFRTEGPLSSAELGDRYVEMALRVAGARPVRGPQSD